MTAPEVSLTCPDKLLCANAVGTKNENSAKADEANIPCLTRVIPNLPFVGSLRNAFRNLSAAFVIVKRRFGLCC
jgi:hypothetical protein